MNRREYPQKASLATNIQKKKETQKLQDAWFDSVSNPSQWKRLKVQRKKPHVAVCLHAWLFKLQMKQAIHSSTCPECIYDRDGRTKVLKKQKNT